MLQNFFYPILKTKRFIIFQQDGAPAHFVHGWMISSIIDGLRGVDRFHRLHSHLTNPLWTFSMRDILEQIFTKQELKN